MSDTSSQRGGVPARKLAPYVASLLSEWELDDGEATWREVDATCCYVDVSGFTTISERLSRLGKIGAEQLTDFLDSVFSGMLAIAEEKGGSLLKFGGDSLLLCFESGDHARLGAEAAVAMRAALAATGSLPTGAGNVSLRASMGLHTGGFHFFRVGNSHHELIVAGPATTTVIRMEQQAGAGVILLSDAMANRMPRRWVGAADGPGRRLATRQVVGGGPGTAPPRAVRSATLEAAVPLGLREWLADRSGGSQHRLATIAFVRFQGVDDLIGTVGPHSAALAIDGVVRAVQAAADAEGVTFLASDIDANGGKIILTAGVPVALEDDEGRVLRAARRILEHRSALAIQIGVNRDHIFAGDIGTQARRTFTVMGDGVNVAARLTAAANPGELLATASVLDYARTEFVTRELAPLHVKGKKDLLQAWEVGRATGVKAASHGFLPFMGREAELGALVAALSELGDSQGRVAVVEGERGAGKTRLVRELGEVGQVARTFTLQGEPFGMAIPYLPLRTPLRQLLDIDAADRAHAGVQLEVAMQALVPEIAALAPLLAPLVDAELAETPETEALGERFIRARVVAMLARAIEAASVGTLLIVAEDAHWFDETTTEICSGLADAARSRPWLVCVTRRPSPDGFSPDDPDVELRLAALPDATSRELVEAATESAPLRPHERDRLVAQASGNPLFLEELLRIVRSTSLESLPDSLDAIAMREIDALPGSSRRVLLVASVLGRVFNRGLLERLVADEGGALEASLDGLEEVLLDDGPGRLRFRHALLQESAYQSLPFKDRLALHCRAGTAIESSGDDADDTAALLSWHFHEADDWERAWRYARLAAKVALAAHAPGEAIVHLERAVGAGKHLDAVPDSEMAGVLAELGDVLVVMGIYDRADDAYRRAALATPEDAVGCARMASERAYLRIEYQGRLPAAIRQVHAGIALIDALTSPDREADRVRASLVTREAVVRYRQGRLAESMRLSDEAIRESERVGDLRSLALALSLLDQCLAEVGRADEATHMERALEIYEELGDYAAAAMTLSNLGSLAFYVSQWTRAADYFLRSAEAATTAGDLATAAVAETNLGELLVNQGDLERAASLLAPALRTLESFGYRAGIAQATMHLGRARAFLGDTAAGQELVAESASQFADAGIQMGSLEARAHLAEVLVHAGELEAAKAVLAQARVAERSLGESPVSSLLDRVEITEAVVDGRVDEARARLVASAARARELGAAYDLFVLLTLEARLGVVDDDTERASLEHDLGIVAVRTVPGP